MNHPTPFATKMATDRAGLYSDRLPASNDLTILLCQAIDAKQNDKQDHELARERFILRLVEKAGISRNMLALARAEGMFP